MRVNLSGIVAADEDVEIYQWFGYKAFGPQTVRDAIAQNPAGEELVLEINSGGGSVMAGSEIYSVLRAAENVRTRAEIQSLAASAASYLALGCRRVDISPAAQMMIHLPTTRTDGDRNDHLESVQVLDTIRDSILNVYELKCAGKTPRSELKRLMNAATWLTAQEAVQLGLCDGILGDEGGALVAPANIMNAAGGLPDIAALRAQYRAAQEQKPATPGDPPVEHTPNDWQAEARLAIEKIRF